MSDDLVTAGIYMCGFCGYGGASPDFVHAPNCLYGYESELAKACRERDALKEEVSSAHLCNDALNETLEHERKVNTTLSAENAKLREALEQARWEIAAVQGILPTIDEVLSKEKPNE